jgi:hypothetical protein
VPSGARKYPLPDVKILWGLAAARCAFPKCRVECVEDATDADGPVVLGKIAHIVAHSEVGPRADPTFPPEKVDSYANWILLCGLHHDIVDGQANTYAVDDLRRWKEEHEDWVRFQLTTEMPGVGFAELEVVSKAILSAPLPPGFSFDLTPLREKMNRNKLSARVNIYFNMGLSKAKEVADFVSNMSVLNSDFPEELKAGFVQEYDRLRASGLDGDALFESLHEFASAGSREFRRRAAGLAVLLYLFEKCEIFES